MKINLENIKPGLALSLFGLAFGIAMGIAFGINEDTFKDFIAQGIANNPTLHDDKSPAKIWRYVQRAHFHSTGIAAFTIALLVLLGATNMRSGVMKCCSALLGLSFLYPLAWYSMYYFSPSLGRSAAHSHIATEVFTYLGVGGLTLGFSLLISNLFFGAFSEKTIHPL